MSMHKHAQRKFWPEHLQSSRYGNISERLSEASLKGLTPYDPMDMKCPEQANHRAQNGD